MSIQEVGTMIKKGVTPYLFVINNDGCVFPSSCDSRFAHASLCLSLAPSLRSLAPLASYEIERQIHGVKAAYNDIQMYDHQQLLPFMVGRKTVRPPPSGRQPL